MPRRVFLALALWIGVTPLCLAGRPTSMFTISTPDKKLYLSVRDGRATLTPQSREIEWVGKPDAARWYIEGVRIKSTVSKGYLAYDAHGKVFLTVEPRDDAQWSVTIDKSKRAEGFRGLIEASSGPMRGWQLGVQEAKETVEGREIVVPRPVLAEKTDKLKAERIWEHK